MSRDKPSVTSASLVDLFEDQPITRLQPSPAGTPSHWKCPDCFEGCYCTDAAARAMPHARCGRPKKKRGKIQ